MCFQAKQERDDIFIEEKFYKVWISLIHGLGIKRYLNLLKVFKKKCKELFKIYGNE